MPINIDRPDFDEPRDQEGFRALRAGIGRQAGARLAFLDKTGYYDGESAPG